MSGMSGTCTHCSAPLAGERCSLCGRPHSPAHTRGLERAGRGKLRRVRRGEALVAAPVASSAQLSAPHLRRCPRRGLVEGIVVESRGPVPMSPRFNLWKAVTLLLLALALGPFFLSLWALVFSLRVTLWALGPRGLMRDPGLMEGMLIHQLLGCVVRARPAVPVYHHRLERPDVSRELVLVRQEGEFLDGCIMVGNTVRLFGARRGGTLLVRGGFNLTLGSRLTLRRNPWRLAAAAVLLLLCLEGLCGLALAVAHLLG